MSYYQQIFADEQEPTPDPLTVVHQGLTIPTPAVKTPAVKTPTASAPSVTVPTMSDRNNKVNIRHSERNLKTFLQLLGDK